ncbi:hypothetical protein TSAR_008218 [Trichomalopsis sarcophagae]|uniref:Uncharacterized protein n=1 Tax=Trichomalopsis sarcophagae TaxID=543379 RepID=A0A232FMV6_9HYME|nr:hypothetical protein TSAR_008218 [Trichomalopsis sarcophagae]
MLQLACTLLSRLDNSVSEGIGKPVRALARYSKSVFITLGIANRSSVSAINCKTIARSTETERFVRDHLRGVQRPSRHMLAEWEARAAGYVPDLYRRRQLNIYV